MQLSLFEDDPRLKTELPGETSGTFTPNLRLPVHRWFRYSAGFATEWVEAVIKGEKHCRAPVIFDPFAGSGTTLIAAENCGVESWGIDAHPFVARIAEAKLEWRSDPISYRKMTESVLKLARTLTSETSHYPDLIQRCFEPAALSALVGRRPQQFRAFYRSHPGRQVHQWRATAARVSGLRPPIHFLRGRAERICDSED